ncbi:hypothetical protein BH20CHL6_BH20CHL6_09470 [soil metagenome]
MTLSRSVDRTASPVRALRSRLLQEFRGPRVVLAVIVIMELATQQVVSMPYLLPGLLLVMVYAAFSFGLRSGQISAALALVYLAVFFSREPFISEPGYTFRLLAIMACGAVAAFSLTILLQRIEAARAQLDQRELEFDRANTLTSMGSRLRLQEDMVQLRERANRHAHRYTVALCDLDRFTAFNRTEGYRAGDEVIVRIASALTDAVRATDTVYRYGGEAFVVVMPEQGREAATDAMNRLRRSIQSMAIAHPENAPAGVVTMSVGVAFLEPGERRGSEEVLEAAYEALDRAKSEGRNRVATEGPQPAAEAVAAPDSAVAQMAPADEPVAVATSDETAA